MTVTADESGLILTLFNGYSYKDIEEKNVPQDKRKYPFRRDKFSEQTMIIELTGFGLNRSGMDLYRSNYAMLSTTELTFYIDSLADRYKTRSDSYYEEFRKTRVFTPSYYFSGGYHLYGDTAAAKELEDFNCRGVFDTLAFIGRSTSISRALNYARDGSAFITEKSESMLAELKNLKKYEAEIYKRYTLPLACLVFFFIGAPLGAIIRKGGLGTPAVISVLFFVFYYVISLSGEKFAKELIIGVPVGMLASTIILLPIGVFLTYKATTDAAIMNTETYVNFFRKVGAFLAGIKPEKENEDPGTVA
jgi:lipopolysaccharide export system permease protein